jgi:hypothetical protein
MQSHDPVLQKRRAMLQTLYGTRFGLGHGKADVIILAAGVRP